MKLITLSENLVGEWNGYSLGTANIWEREGKMSAKLTIWSDSVPEKTFTVSKGDKVVFDKAEFEVMDVSSEEGKLGSITLKPRMK